MAKLWCYHSCILQVFTRVKCGRACGTNGFYVWLNRSLQESSIEQIVLISFFFYGHLPRGRLIPNPRARTMLNRRLICILIYIKLHPDLEQILPFIAHISMGNLNRTYDLWLCCYHCTNRPVKFSVL